MHKKIAGFWNRRKEEFSAGALMAIPLSNYLSGELKSETGTAIVPKFYEMEYFPTITNTLAIQAAQPWDPEDSGSQRLQDYVLNRSYATSDAVIAWFGASLIEDYLSK